MILQMILKRKVSVSGNTLPHDKISPYDFARNLPDDFVVDFTERVFRSKIFRPAVARGDATKRTQLFT